MEILEDLKGMDRTVWIRFIASILNSAAIYMMMPFFALYLKEEAHSVKIVGILMALGPIASMMGSVIGGKLTDYYGRKPLMFVSNFGTSLMMLGFLSTYEFWSYALLSIGLGLFRSLFQPAASAMVADVTPLEKRNAAFGLLRMGFNIGGAIGPLVGASVFFISKNTIFILTSVLMFVSALLILFFLKETLPSSQKTKIILWDGSSSTINILRNDRMLLLYIFSGIWICMSFILIESMTAVHFENELQNIFSASNPFPYLVSLNAFMVIFFQLHISNWVSKKPIGNILLLGSFLLGIGLLLVGWLPLVVAGLSMNWLFAIFFLAVGYIIYTLGEIIVSPAQTTLISILSPENLRGTYMGVAGLQWNIGNIIGPLFGGVLLDASLGELLFTIMGISCLVSGLVYYYMVKKMIMDTETI